MINDDQKLYLVPGAIIITGLLIAGAIIYSNGGNLQPASITGKAKDTSINQDDSLNNQNPDDSPADNINPINDKDHIRGNPNAPIKIVEFSDLECPFCKRFHSSMAQIVEEYGKDGQVAWVYRHFPLTQIHSKAPREAEAAECANELGGNGKFWEYIDTIFEITPGNNGLDLTKLPQIAEDIGIDRQQFEACLDSERHKDRIQDDTKDAMNSGGRGTPYSVVIAENGQKFVINGAQPYSVIKDIVESALAAKN